VHPLPMQIHPHALPLAGKDYRIVQLALEYTSKHA
jgi:hypothetical protein